MPKQPKKRLIIRFPKIKFKSYIFPLLLLLLLPVLVLGVGQKKNTRNYASTTYTVLIQHFAVSPTNLTVHAGDTVIWINKDIEGHSMVSDSHLWSSPLLKEGDRFSFTFTAPGTYTYYCSSHKSSMHDYTITVLPVDAP